MLLYAHLVVDLFGVSVEQAYAYWEEHLTLNQINERLWREYNEKTITWDGSRGGSCDQRECR